MRRMIIMCMHALFIFVFAAYHIAAGDPEESSGEALFNKHCAVCHPAGGNVVNPEKTLKRKDRETNNIITAKDIVNKIRNPGPVPDHPKGLSGMTPFDEATLSNDDALKIAYYVLQTFK